MERELKVSFLDEASQHLDDCEVCFLNLENNKENVEYIEKIFRLAHNLKGTARAVGFGHVAIFTHELESLLLKIKNKTLSITDQTVSLLLECNDHLRVMVGVLRGDLDAKIEHGELLERVKNHGTAAETVTKVPEQKTELSTETEKSSDTNQPDKMHSVVAQDETIRVSINRLERLNNFVGELVILQSMLNQHAQQAHSPLLSKTVSQLNKITKEIQQISMSCRMIPLKQTFQKLKRVARDTSVSLEKLVDLEIFGEETEVDKTVIEHLSDPLVHIIRNAVDHGLESPAERIELGKPERGSIKMLAYHKGSHLVIEIRDDGRGLDNEVIKARAIEKGLLKADAKITDEEIQQLIFLPGFSTKTEVSEISGRGVGLDVAKNNIERLSGDVQLESQKGKGTLFKVFFPLTLAITEGLIIRMDSEKYVIPLSQIFETVHTHKDLIEKVVGKGEVLNLRGETIPLFHLRQLLHMSEAPANEKSKDLLALVIKGQKHLFAVVVDEVIRQQQVVMKQMGAEIRHRQGLLGSSILGDGKPAMILDLNDLLKGSIGNNFNKTHQPLEGLAS